MSIPNNFANLPLAERNGYFASAARDYRQKKALDSLAQDQSNTAVRVELVSADTIKPEPIHWLWSGFLARGKFHVLAGAPGTGKTTLAIQMAAIVSSGGNWPDGSRCPEGNVIIWSGEDDPRDTLVPRLAAAGANLKRVFFVGDIQQGQEARCFDPAKDMPVLTQRLEAIGGAALCIVDPVVSAVVGDGHKSNDVRRGLQPLVELAMALECALIGISHFSKGTGGRDPLERVTGSIAYGALARVVLVAAKEQRSEDEGKPERRVLMRAKSNIGSDAGGFEYSLNQEPVPHHEGMFASVASFGSLIEGTAREVLSDTEAEDTGDRSVFNEAHDWLLDFLIDGPKPTKQIKTEASAAGHSWATVKRAKVKLNIRAKKVGLDQGWEWVLPGPES